MHAWSAKRWAAKDGRKDLNSILPHIFLPVLRLLDGGERDLPVSDFGPMYGLDVVC